ncbi:hypothetical protein K7X08_005107 [Anisodus acutangulus]|uniref:Uncharacterized protein n=1 Tax=Anisodus acutangulus TaxID=402998 RepID=A0A9Q1MEX7_9SOLA|nr:hypothetical protein K7X08_005107 [Anisodus acutangulus]
MPSLYSSMDSADKCVLASSGFQADVRALQKVLAARHLVKCQNSDNCCFCSYLDMEHVREGLCFGSYERVGYSSQGSGSTLIMPFLDNQLKSPSPLWLPAKVDAVTPLSESEAIDLVMTCFASATERDIYSGDSLEMVILNGDGVRREQMDLRRD